MKSPISDIANVLFLFCYVLLQYLHSEGTEPEEGVSIVE